ncbi:MAG: hypothetical protein ACE5E1_07305 [Phycisphaerae bacterium]
MNAQREHAASVVVAPRQHQTVLWVIALLLAIIATALVMRPSNLLNLPKAYGEAPMLGAKGLFAFTGQLDKNSYGLFMLDVDNSNVWCYQYVPGRGRLKLVAARSFLYDRYLENLNCAEPTPAQVKLLLDDQRRIKERIHRGGIAPDESSEALGTGVPGLPDPAPDRKDRGGN